MSKSSTKELCREAGNRPPGGEEVPMEAQWLLRRHKSHLTRKAGLLSTLKYQNRPESRDLIEKVKAELQMV